MDFKKLFATYSKQIKNKGADRWQWKDDKGIRYQHYSQESCLAKLITGQADMKARRITGGIFHNDKMVNLPGSNTDKFVWI